MLWEWLDVSSFNSCSNFRNTRAEMRTTRTRKPWQVCSAAASSRSDNLHVSCVVTLLGVWGGARRADEDDALLLPLVVVDGANAHGAQAALAQQQPDLLHLRTAAA